ALALLVVAAMLEAWAMRATDPDFYLPDPYHGVVMGLVVLYGIAGVTPWALARRALYTLVFAVPIVILAMEVRLATRDRDIASSRLVVSDDRLLRYTYRPGGSVRDSGGEM